MENYTKSFVSLTFVAVFIFTLLVSSQAQTKISRTGDWDFRKHQAEIIDYAKKYPVSNIEPNLPRMSFANWFQKAVGAKRKVNWNLADCGMQNHIPLDGKKLDAPMCVETTVPIAGTVLLHVLIQYGTFERGITEMKPIVRIIFFGENTFATVETLRDLPEKVRLLRKSLVSFDPNHGEFVISGEKPAGFEDFSSIWFQTVDYDSNDKPFAVKKYGDIEAGAKHYQLRDIFFNGKRWSFETAAIGGTSYKFDGVFAKLKLDRDGAVDGNKVLRGRLIKFVKGKKAAEANLIFNFYYLGDAG